MPCTLHSSERSDNRHLTVQTNTGPGGERDWRQAVWAQIMKKGWRSDELPVIAADCDHVTSLHYCHHHGNSHQEYRLQCPAQAGRGMPFRHLETWLETVSVSVCVACRLQIRHLCLSPNLQHRPAVRVSSAVCSQAREIIFVFGSYFLSTLCRATSLYLSL